MFNRRDFLRSGLLTTPVLASGSVATSWLGDDLERKPVRFTGDGPMYAPDEFIAKLAQINQAHPIERDFYGKGGSVDALTKQFATLTGKEAAIYLASGTLANQLALSVLSGENTKVFVQQTSHVYRDEADAAQSVFGKRLIPLAADKAYFTLAQLQQAIEEYSQGEAFKSGIGAVSIENPVRRCNGQFVPIDDIKAITAYCRQQGYGLHLDGARLYLAAAYSGTSVAEYASHFDTVYISLYKYMGAAGGAVLCGPKAIIDKMEHLAKVHGGVMFTNWANAAMALHHLTGLEDQLRRSATQAKQLFSQLNQLPQLKITPIAGGTNISTLQLASSVNAATLTEVLWQKHQIGLAKAKTDGSLTLMVNDSLLNRTNEQLVAAFQDAFRQAKA